MSNSININENIKTSLSINGNKIYAKPESAIRKIFSPESLETNKATQEIREVNSQQEPLIDDISFTIIPGITLSMIIYNDLSADLIINAYGIKLKNTFSIKKEGKACYELGVFGTSVSVCIKLAGECLLFSGNISALFLDEDWDQKICLNDFI